ncbi:choline/ethanolamine kinase [Colletotrichum higginsianum]|nr:choline/ethanolamine kinase [Colletotrichum higginsianum]
MSSSSPQVNGLPLRSALKTDDDSDKPSSSATTSGKGQFSPRFARPYLKSAGPAPSSSGIV